MLVCGGGAPPPLLLSPPAPHDDIRSEKKRRTTYGSFAPAFSIWIPLSTMSTNGTARKTEDYEKEVNIGLVAYTRLLCVRNFFDV